MILETDMRTWQLTLTPAPGEEPITRTVDHDEMVEAVRALMAGEYPAASELAVDEIAVPRAAVAA